MAYDHKGTSITGTSTTSKKFTKSKVENAKKNDTYFNTETGHVYKCTTAGAPSKAEWQYVRTDIAHKPGTAVKGLSAPKRTTVGTGKYWMEASWKIPAELTKEKSGKRATGLYIDWWLGIAGKDPKQVNKTGNESLTSNRINLNNLTIGSKNYTRASFYPYPGKPKLDYITVGVIPFNSKGKGPVSKEKREFKKPRAPVISKPTFNTENGHVTCTITTNAGTDYYERHDTWYKVSAYRSATKKTDVHRDAALESTSISVSYDASDYQNLDYKNYIKITIEAKSRGFKGDTAAEPKVYYVSYPAKAVIKDVKVSGTGSTDKCTIKLDTKSTASHPVDVVKLEYLPNVEYAKATDIPGDAVWESTDIQDDAECTALSIGVAELLPDPGRHTWIRLKTYHGSETVLYRYSEYKRLSDLERPASTAEDDDITIISAVPGADGESVVVQLAWNADGTDDSTGTELSWAEEEDAWRSTKEPDTYEFTWSDGQYPPEGTAEYQDSAKITIKGLEEGINYYVKARRFLEGDTTSYSKYSKPVVCMTNETPDAVVASCDRYVPVGESLPVYWTFSGKGIQTEWQIVAQDETTIVDKGENSLGSTQISGERLSSLATDGSLTFRVEASAGSDFVQSDWMTVTIIDPPVLTLTAAAVLTAQSLSFSAAVTTLCDLSVVVSSQGASGQFPEGLKRQTAGDTIYSAILSPTWTEDQSEENWTAEIDLPQGLDFWDLGNYTLAVTAIDRMTGLRSEEVPVSFAVAWANPAVSPEEAVELVSVDEIDDSGMHHQAVDIVLTPPEGSAETDVYDIYRLTGDGPRLIGEGFPLTYTARDEYAPFGDAMTHYYRVALRTIDGDVEFADIEYVAEGRSLRFDWAGGSLELPYNISIADKYKKDAEIRKHMDGSTDGYWNQNIERTASLATDVIRIDQQEDIAMARRLARYAGPVFVRTPDGSAYEADVQISDMSTEGPVMAIAIDATEIGLTQEFILPTPYELEEEEP